MTIDRFIDILDDAEFNSDFVGDRTYAGLQILSKYTSYLIQGAGHDVIWSEDIDVLIEKGITEEDAIKLSELGWYVKDESYLAIGV